MAHDITDTGIHAATLDMSDFVPVENPAGYGSAWNSWRAQGPRIHGSHHQCCKPGQWSITIHDLMLAEDILLEFDEPDNFSVAWCDSISGEEFTPYRKLRARSIWAICSGEGGWRGIAHAGVPARSIAIEATPAYLRAFLDAHYPRRFPKIRDAFASLTTEVDFPELKRLLRGLQPHPGDPDQALASYEQQVNEALRIVVDHTLAYPVPEARTVSVQDRERIFAISAYIDDHYTRILKVPDLARVAGMSPTKFKECFKAVTGCTLTQYIQRRRISQAEQMLHQPSLSVELISHAVGYTCVSRFSELFRRETGLLPSEYRKGL